MDETASLVTLVEIMTKRSTLASALEAADIGNPLT
jgi:hypothetical protein